MAATKTKPDKQLYERLRDSGVRKKVAKQVSEALPKQGASKTAPARKAAAALDSAVGEINDRMQGGPRKRSEAAKKAARTRKQKERDRSRSAEKAARSRSSG